MIAPVSRWLASGVRRPFIQSSARGTVSSKPRRGGRSSSAGMISSATGGHVLASPRPEIPRSVGKMVSSGQASSALNQAYTSPNADWPAS